MEALTTNQTKEFCDKQPESAHMRALAYLYMLKWIIFHYKSLVNGDRKWAGLVCAFVFLLAQSD